ncbi:MAG: hypothetical protein KGL52_06070, partial [Rhodospirillales bacterium]|nr:hypothetical protein [Rhodospirillales bacterium]
PSWPEARAPGAAAAGPGRDARGPDASGPDASGPNASGWDARGPDATGPGTGGRSAWGLRQTLRPRTTAGLDRLVTLWIGVLVVATAAAAWLMLAVATGPTSGLPDGTAPPPPRPGWAQSGWAQSGRIRSAALPFARPSGPGDHFALPGLGPVTVWQDDPRAGGLRPVARLHDFAAVHVLGPGPAPRLAAIQLAGLGIGFVARVRLAAGSQQVAFQAFCADHAGAAPANGTVLARRGGGRDWFAVINRDLEPAVVKLRGADGRVVGSIYLDAGGRAALRGLPHGPWTVEFAVGELWSQACGLFAAGERAQRFRFPLASGSILALPPDLPPRAMPVDIADRTFAEP